MKNNNRHGQAQILDTFPDFEEYWKQYRHSPRRVQVEAWESGYMGKWPALLKKQIGQYRSEGVDWKKVAEKRIFPYLKTRLASMRLARKRLLEESVGIIHKAMGRFRVHHPVYVIIYVGIGLGAGWATIYKKSPALLFGLENIAEEGWTSKSEIRGLVSHELSHLLHSYWRGKVGRRFGCSPLWQLYTEGFADRLEFMLQGSSRSHRAKGADEDDWPSWYSRNRRWLVKEFLKRLETDGDMKPFFGSWYTLGGHSQSGYFLGSDLIKTLEKSYSPEEIATLSNISKRMRAMLGEIARGNL